MKKHLFWKILSIIFLVWLFLWLWHGSIEAFKIESGNLPTAMKINKITGKVRVYFYTKGVWEEYKPMEKEEEK